MKCREAPNNIDYLKLGKERGNSDAEKRWYRFRKDKAKVPVEVRGEVEAAVRAGVSLQALAEIVFAPTAEPTIRTNWEGPVLSSNAPSAEPQ